MSALPSASSPSGVQTLPSSCPKCGASRPPGVPDCPSCGIVFAKVEARLAEASAKGRREVARGNGALDGARARRRVAGPARAVGVTPTVEPERHGSPGLEERAVAGVVFWASAGLWLLLAYLTLRFATHSVASNFAGASPLHLVNLVFHEAGHVVFSPFGRVVMVLGGSLLQFIVPIVCAVAFVRRGDRFATSVAVWWAGQNLVDLAPYVNDARALQLVLLGGRTGAEVEGHDWEFLLQTFRISHLDHGIAGALHGVGLLVMGAALAWGVWELKRLRQANDEVDEGSGTAQFSDRGADFTIGR